ncbi:hypothetical protein CK572_07485, partial [Campylobacter coli]|nr:hypothetical protein [Campylobacter coli]
MLWKKNDLLELKYSSIEYDELKSNFTISVEKQSIIHVIVFSDIFSKEFFDTAKITIEFSLNKKDWIFIDE